MSVIEHNEVANIQSISTKVIEMKKKKEFGQQTGDMIPITIQN